MSQCMTGGAFPDELNKALYAINPFANYCYLITEFRPGGVCVPASYNQGYCHLTTRATVILQPGLPSSYKQGYRHLTTRATVILPAGLPSSYNQGYRHLTIRATIILQSGLLSSYNQGYAQLLS